MAEEFNTKKQYTKYTRHVNDSGERVDAQHINTIQKDLQDYQTQLNDMKDTAFEERVYTIFQNNYYVNAMFMDSFYNEIFIDKTLSANYTFEREQGILSAAPDKATIVSAVVKSKYGDPVPLNDFILIANEKIPVGASIKYYLETEAGESWQILSNKTKNPLTLRESIKYGFKLRIEMTTNAMGESPELNGYAILFFDQQVEDNLGMTNPDLRRFP